MAICGYENLDPSPGDDWDTCLYAAGPEHRSKYDGGTLEKCSAHLAAEKDVKLFDAAPKMLAVLKMYLKCGAKTKSDMDFFEEQFRAIVAAAEGRDEPDA